MKTLSLILLALAALAGGLALYVRLAPSDPAQWHVDPLTVSDPATPNFARANTVIPAPVADVAARLAAVARADGAVLLAGDPNHATWISRTRLMRFPDYTSIRLDPAEGGTRVTAFARSRFGRGDMGVNRARLDRWLAALRAG